MSTSQNVLMTRVRTLRNQVDHPHARLCRLAEVVHRGEGNRDHWVVLALHRVAICHAHDDGRNPAMLT